MVGFVLFFLISDAPMQRQTYNAPSLWRRKHAHANTHMRARTHTCTHMHTCMLRYVNHRIHPLDGGTDEVTAYDRSVIADPRVKLALRSDGDDSDWTPPAPVSSTAGMGYMIIKKTVAACFGAPVVGTAHPRLRLFGAVRVHVGSPTKDGCHPFFFSVVFSKLFRGTGPSTLRTCSPPEPERAICVLHGR